MTPCQKLGYKVGDEFIIQKETCGFVKGQTVELYEDDGTNEPLFRGDNMCYNHCDGREGAYFDLDLVIKVVKEEKEEMQFDMKKEPWYIRVANEQEYELVQNWLLENYGTNCVAEYSREFKYLTNTYSGGHVNKSWVMYGSGNKPERQEIKLTFKTVIDSVTFPEVKTEQQKQIEELEKTILLAKQQIETLKKGE